MLLSGVFRGESSWEGQKKNITKKNVMEEIVVLDSSKRKQCVFFFEGEGFDLKKLLWMLLSLCLSKRFLVTFQCSLNSGCFFGGKRSYG